MKTTIRLAIAAILAFALSAHAGPLHDAAGTGNLHEINQLLANGLEPNQPDHKGHTPLHHAAVRFEMPELVRTLIDAGADPNARAKDGSTPLHYAVGAARNLAARALLDAGADPNARNNDNDTPLHYLAAGWGPTPGAGVEGLAALAAITGAAATGTRSGQATGLIAGMFALAGAAHNRKKIGWTVRELVAAGVNFDARNDAGETPAELARRLGNTNQAKYMDGPTIANEDFVAAVEAKNVAAAAAAIQRGAVPTARELVRAASLADPQLVDLILEAGVDASASHDAPEAGWTALHAVANRPNRWRDETDTQRNFDVAQRVAIAKRLIEKGADPHAPTPRGTTPLRIASGFNLTEIAALFRGSLASSTTDLATQFERALASRDLAWITALINAGFDPDGLDSEGRTRICRAIMVGSRKIIEALHSAGASLTGRNADGKTTFHCLVLRKTHNYGSLGMWLLKHDVPLDAKDDAGRDVLEFANEMNNPAMVRFAGYYGPIQRAERPKPPPPNRTFLQ